MYLAAVMDGSSRFVLSWALSVTMEVPFCIRLWKRRSVGRRPEIFNSDGESQFTSEGFTGVLKERDIAISMDGRRRCLDNIFIERLAFPEIRRCVHLRDYRLVPEASGGHLGHYFQFYNYERDRIRAWITERRRISIEAGMRGRDRINGRRALLNWGLCPKPRNLPLSGQNGCFGSIYNEAPGEDRAPQECDPSADSSAGMAELRPPRLSFHMPAIDVSEPQVIAKSGSIGRSKVVGPRPSWPRTLLVQWRSRRLHRLYLTEAGESIRAARRLCQSDSRPTSFPTSLNPDCHSDSGMASICRRFRINVQFQTRRSITLLRLENGLKPGRFHPDRIMWTGPLSSLILNAYRLRNYQFSGPSWLDAEQFTIVAKIPTGASYRKKYRSSWQNAAA